jgi:hypothetical protein
MNWRPIWDDVIGALNQFRKFDLRWSYLVAAAAVLIGAIASIYLPHGWAIWPVVFVVSLIAMVHEASSRNTDEIPPLQVYALFGGMLVVCLLWLVLMAAAGPWLLIVAMPLLVWYTGKGIIENRRREKLIVSRRAEGLCVGCGEPLDPSFEVCPQCGVEVNPDGDRLKRVARMAQSTVNSARSREVIKGNAKLTHAQRREQQISSRRQRVPGRQKSQ